MSVDALVEVTAVIFKKGNKTSIDSTIELSWLKSFEDSTREYKEEQCDIPFPQKPLWMVEFIEENIGFKFQIIGENGGAYSSGLYWEYDENKDHIFEEYLEDLAKIAKEKYQRFSDKKTEDSCDSCTDNIVRFITVWSYSMDQDYCGEWDSSYDLLGEISIHDLNLLLKDKKENPDKYKIEEEPINLDDILREIHEDGSSMKGFL